VYVVFTSGETECDLAPLSLHDAKTSLELEVAF